MEDKKIDISDLEIRKNQKIDINDLENKNFILDISDMNSSGQGVGKIEGLTIFVDGAITGEKIEAKVTELKKNYCIGTINKIIEPSPYRTEPFCEVFDTCGGCSLQHISYEYQLKYKTRKVKDEIERISGIRDIKINEIIGMENPLNYRNKAEYFIDNPNPQNSGPDIGFYARGSHEVVEHRVCHICSLESNEIKNYFKELLINDNNGGGTNSGDNSGGSNSGNNGNGCSSNSVDSSSNSSISNNSLSSNNNKNNLKSLTVRKSFGTGEVMVIISAYENKVINDRAKNPGAVSGQTGIYADMDASITKSSTGNPDCSSAASTVVSLAARLAAKFPSIKSIYLSKIGKHHTTYDLLYGKKTIRENINGYSFDISPGSFFQVNTSGAEILFAAALKYAGLSGSEEVLDLYCGTGAGTILFAGGCKIIIGVEVLKGAIVDAKANARLNSSKNVGFVQGDTLKILRDFERKNRSQSSFFDAAIVDPPRTGMEAEVIKVIADLKIKKIIYISCSPSTLARDIKRFSENGYSAMEIQPIDMFPHTEHVECVVLLTNVTSK